MGKFEDRSKPLDIRASQQDLETYIDGRMASLLAFVNHRKDL
jgi:hypothetical protein